MMDRTSQADLLIITAAVAEVRAGLVEVPVPVDRRTLAKRLWRGVAADGTCFGFQLEGRLAPDTVIHQTSSHSYVIRQHPEACLLISFAQLPASAVAGIAWSVGNLHLEFSADLERMVTPDEPAARRLLERLGIGFCEAPAVFRPGHFKRHAAPAQELGTSHRHEP
jgi:urease accessory protein